jgi:hypothetical protein
MEKQFKLLAGMLILMAVFVLGSLVLNEVFHGVSQV